MQPCLFYFCMHRNIAICSADQRIFHSFKGLEHSIDLYCVKTYRNKQFIRYILQSYSITISVPNMWRINSKQTAKNIKMCNNALQNVRHFVTYMYF